LKQFHKIPYSCGDVFPCPYHYILDSESQIILKLSG
jgi:hypothetical protein